MIGNFVMALISNLLILKQWLKHLGYIRDPGQPDGHRLQVFRPLSHPLSAGAFQPSLRHQ
jgi:hypothetical protein